MRAYPRFPTVKAHAYVVALEIGTHLLNPDWVPSDALLQVAKSRYDATAKFGTSDFLSTVYFQSLQRAGRVEEARATINEYTRTVRRDRSPLAHDLKQLENELGC